MTPAELRRWRTDLEAINAAVERVRAEVRRMQPNDERAQLLAHLAPDYRFAVQQLSTMIYRMEEQR